MSDRALQAAEQYQSALYAKVQDQESRAEWGMPIQELHAKEAHFALEASGITDWKDGDKILDLASGKGGHARELAVESGANVHAFDLSESLVALGNEEILGASEGFASRVKLQMGNMLKVNEATQEQYRLITILGSSFIFFERPEQIVEALRSYYDRLEPGGKLVIQFRSPVRNKKGVRTRVDPNMETFEEEREVALRRNQQLPRGVDAIYGVREKDTRKYHYAYVLPVSVPAGTPEDNIQRNALGETVSWTDEEGIRHQAFERVYGDEGGNETPMGKAEITELNRIGVAPVLERKFIEAGFENVHIKEEDLANDTMMFCVVGKKSLD